MSSENYKESGYGLNLDLLTIPNKSCCTSYKSGLVGKRHVYLDLLPVELSQKNSKSVKLILQGLECKMLVAMPVVNVKLYKWHMNALLLSPSCINYSTPFHQRLELAPNPLHLRGS